MSYMSTKREGYTLLKYIINKNILNKLISLADNERFEEALELETRLNLQMAKIDDLRSKVEVYNNLNEVVERLGNQPLDIERMNRFLEWKKLAELRIIKELKVVILVADPVGSQ
ncbi:unnamed protein product [Rhizophagus irregularis]|nr:unnamed protein product [Rhizophagus irregularis]